MACRQAPARRMVKYSLLAMAHTPIIQKVSQHGHGIGLCLFQGTFSTIAKEWCHNKCSCRSNLVGEIGWTIATSSLHSFGEFLN